MSMTLPSSLSVDERIDISSDMANGDFLESATAVIRFRMSKRDTSPKVRAAI